MTNILPGSSSYYMPTVMIRSMWDMFACCLVTVILYRIHYSGFDLLHPNIAAWLHCCWQLRNALGSKVQYRFSSLFECLENELMRYSHVCQAVVVSMTLVTVALYINVLNGYQCSDWTSMVFVSESSITSNCQSAAWHTDSSTICSWVPCARIRTFWASAKGWEIPKPQHKDQNLSVGTKILISKQAMGKDRQADT